MQFWIGRETAMRRTVITVLLLAAFGVAHAADPNTSATDAREHTPLSIAIDGPKGMSFRLIYTVSNGWEFADPAGPKLVRAGQQEGLTGSIAALPTGAPQSVFVDGPSGYVFVYVLDEGWRFVGSVADRKR
jgi:hypothetical protein